MKVIVNTLEGNETLHDITNITEFDGATVFADSTGKEYHSLNDFPTMYRFEVIPQQTGE